VETAVSDTPPAGWYPDPQDANRQRYWDGTAWTEHTADGTPQAPASGTAAATTTSTGPDTWTWQSIIATIFCCNILGVVGVLNAGRAEHAVRSGDVAAANEYAARARKWTLWSAGIMVLLIALYVVFIVIVAGTTGFSEFSDFNNL
jgi:hypothetical protein